MKEELFVIIDGERKQLDLNIPSGITLNYKNNMFGDISSIEADYSYSFTLPYTQNNREILKSAEDVRIQNSIRARKTDAEYLQNGVSLIGNAVLYIKSAKTKEGYEAFLKWGNSIELNRLLDKDISLRDLGKYDYTVKPLEGIEGELNYDFIISGRTSILLLYREETGYTISDARYQTKTKDLINIDTFDTPQDFSRLPERTRSFHTLQAVYGAGAVYNSNMDDGFFYSRKHLQYTNSQGGKVNQYTHAWQLNISALSPFAIGMPEKGLGLWDNQKAESSTVVLLRPPLVTPLSYLLNIIERVYGINIEFPEGFVDKFCLPFVRMGQSEECMQQCYVHIKGYNPHKMLTTTRLSNVINLAYFKDDSEETEYKEGDYLTRKTFWFQPNTYSLFNINVDANPMYRSHIPVNYPEDSDLLLFFSYAKKVFSGIELGGGMGYVTYISGHIRVKLLPPTLVGTSELAFSMMLEAFLSTPPKLVWHAYSGEVMKDFHDFFPNKQTEEGCPDFFSTEDVEGRIVDYCFKEKETLYDTLFPKISEMSYIIIDFDMNKSNGFSHAKMSAFSPYTEKMGIYPCIEIPDVTVRYLGMDADEEEITIKMDEQNYLISVEDVDLYIYKGNNDVLSVSDPLDIKHPERPLGLINYFHNLPDISTKDLLNTLFLACGGLPVYDNRAKKIKIKRYQDFYKNIASYSTSLDWSNKIVLEGNDTDSFLYNAQDDSAMQNNIARVNYFLMKNDELDDDGNIKTPDMDEDVYAPGYVKIELDNDALEEEVSQVQSQFYAAYKSQKGVPNAPTGDTLKFWSFKGGINKQDVMYYDASVSEAHPILATVGYKETEDSPGKYYLTIKPWQFNNPDNPDFSNYMKFFKEIHSLSDVIVEYMQLTEFDLRDLDYTTPIYLDKYNAYFGIVEIERYDDGICKVTMFKLPYKDDYIIKYEPYVVIMPKNGGYEYNWEDEVWVALKVKANYYRQDAAAPFKSFDVDINADDIKVNFDHKYGSEEWYWDKERHTVVLTANPEATADYHIQLFFEVNIQDDTLDLSNKSVSYNRKYQQ